MSKIIFVLTVAALAAGCATKDPRVLSPDRHIAAYAETLRRLEAEPAMDPSSPDNAEAIARMKDFFTAMTPETVHAKCANVYAENAWLNDTVKTIEGRAAIEEYFAETAKALDVLNVEFTDISTSGSNYYLRWIMTVKLKDADKPIVSIGMTHMRFTPDGKIAMHQDYWDSAAGLYEHLPVVGRLIRYIKNRI